MVFEWPGIKATYIDVCRFGHESFVAWLEEYAGETYDTGNRHATRSGNHPLATLIETLQLIRNDLP